MSNPVNISIETLHVHPRNIEFFDDIAGEDYEQFKDSIQEEGILHELIVAPDMTIISGHQRYKAALDLGLQTVPVKIREDLLDEDKKLKVLLAANFGRKENSPAKQRKVADEYVRLRGYKNGEHGEKLCQSGGAKIPLRDIAAELGTSERNLQRMLRIERNLTESMKELLDTGTISKVLAADVVAALSPEEQEELVSKLDINQKYTTKQVQQYIEENKRLKEQLSRPTPVEVRTVVERQDTEETLAELEKLKAKLQETAKEKAKLSEMIIQKQTLLSQAMGMNTNYQLVSHCSEITLKMLDFVKEMSQYDYMAESFNEIPTAAKTEYEKCITSVQKWANRILEVIHTQENIIEEGESIYE